MTVEVILIVLIVADHRARQRRLAYPLSLAFFGLLHALMVPIGTGDGWRAIGEAYARLPIFQ